MTTWTSARIFDAYVERFETYLPTIREAVRTKAGLSLPVSALVDAQNLAAQHVIVVDEPVDYLRMQMHTEGYGKSFIETIPPVVVPPFDHCFVEARFIEHPWEAALRDGRTYEGVGVQFTRVDLRDKGIDERLRATSHLAAGLQIGVNSTAHQALAEDARWFVFFIGAVQVSRKTAHPHLTFLLGQTLPVFFGMAALTAQGGLCKVPGPLGIVLGSEESRALAIDTLMKERPTAADRREVLNMMSGILYGLGFANAKNVKMAQIGAPAKMNKSREKRGKKPFVSYHVIDIGPTVRMLREAERSGVPLEQRMHFVRGHFKEYTNEKPLMGRHTGTYWWDAHVRGKIEHGAVITDYNVRGPKKES